jgi:transposase
MVAGTNTDTQIKRSGDDRKRARQSARGNYNLWFKLQVIRETLVPGASVSIVARRYDINSNVVFRWRKEFRDGKYGDMGVSSRNGLPEPEFVEVGRADDAGDVRLLPPPRKPEGESVKAPEPAAECKTPGTPALIEIETAGGVKLRLSGRVDDRALRRVLAAIRRLT